MMIVALLTPLLALAAMHLLQRLEKRTLGDQSQPARRRQVLHVGHAQARSSQPQQFASRYTDQRCSGLNAMEDRRAPIEPLVRDTSQTAYQCPWLAQPGLRGRIVATFGCARHCPWQPGAVEVGGLSGRQALMPQARATPGGNGL
jgi:hypothetical protein